MNCRLIIFLYLLCLATFLSSCSEEKSTKVSHHFVIQNHTLSLGEPSKAAAFYKDRFYILTKSYKLITVDKEYKVDSALTKLSQGYLFDYIYTTDKYLIGGFYPVDSFTRLLYFDDSKGWIPLPNHKSILGSLFEDEQFYVRSCCMGEFGGAIFFEEKRTNKIFSAPITCPTKVLTHNNKYFVAGGVAHMGGSTRIISIDNPTDLYEIKNDSLKHWCNWWDQLDTTDGQGYTGFTEYEVGNEEIIDSVGLLTMTVFISNNKIYSINSTENKTYLNQLKGNKMIVIDTILDNRIWAYHPLNFSYKQTHTYSFMNKELSGFISIQNDTISTVIVE